jgi:hypothetical protein
MTISQYRDARRFVAKDKELLLPHAKPVACDSLATSKTQILILEMYRSLRNMEE